MDIDTMILLFLTFSAFCWWFTLRLRETRDMVREEQSRMDDAQKRADRVRRLMNRR